MTTYNVKSLRGAMYEFHGWFEIAESTEESDAGGSARGLMTYGRPAERPAMIKVMRPSLVTGGSGMSEPKPGPGLTDCALLHSPV